MGDASGTYASPTGSDLQNGGAGQRQGSDDSYENVSFQLDAGEQNSGQDNMRRTSIGTGTIPTLQLLVFALALEPLETFLFCFCRA